MKTLLAFILALVTVSASAVPLTNFITYTWTDFGLQVDSVTNRPVKVTPLEYATVGSFFTVKTPRVYTNNNSGVMVITNQQAGSYRVEFPTTLGSITAFTSTIPATATGGTNYDATAFVTNYATNAGSTRSYSITVSDLRYPSTAGSNILFYTNNGLVTVAGTSVSGTSPTVASNFLYATKLDVTNGNAYNIAFTTNAEWRGPIATNSFMQSGHKFMIRDTRSTNCWIEYTNRADGNAPWTFFESPTTFGRSQSDYIYSKGAALYLSAESLQDQQTIYTGDASFYIYGTNILHGTQNWIVHDNASDLTTFAGDLTVGGFLVSTNLNAKIAAASNTVHTALNSTNTTLVSALATKQAGTLYLTNLAAWGISNIISANSTITLATNSGVLTVTGNGVASGATNYVATTNGIARGLTNNGNFGYGTASGGSITNSANYYGAGHIISTAGSVYTAANSAHGIGQATTPGGIFTMWNQGASGTYDEVAFYRSDSSLLGMMTFGYGTTVAHPAMHFTNANIYFGDATRKFNMGTTSTVNVARLRIGGQHSSAMTITNVIGGDITLDFPSTSSGAVADLSQSFAGVKEGDVVDVAPPTAAMSSIVGSYSGFASNGVVYVRFIPTAASQNPASGTFRVVVTQYK